MKEKMNSLDIRFITKELKPLAGARVQKMWQIGNDFWFSLHGGSKKYLYINPDKAVFLADAKPEAPEYPTSFCMFLRKHISGRRITAVRQAGFDRILEFLFDGMRLVVEMVPPGNIVIVDEEGIIRYQWKVRVFSDRKIAPKERYQYPKLIRDPFAMEFREFFSVLSEGEPLKALSSMGFGREYAEEILDLAGNPAHIDRAKALEIFGILEAADRGPAFFAGEEGFSCMGHEGKKFDSVSEMLNSYFSARKAPEKAIVAPEEKKRTVIEDRQMQSAERMEKEAESSREKAESIRENYGIISEVLSSIRDMKESGKGWDEIEKAMKKDPRFVGIEPSKSKVRLRAGSKDVELDIRKTPMQSISEFFEKSKKSKRKAEGARKMVKKAGERTEKPKKKAPKKSARTKTKWHEIYRWFISSNGLMIAAGRNSRQNESLIRSRVKEGDLVFHADIEGAPFVVIKSAGKGIPPESIKEAYETAVSYSSAWKKGMENADAYYVKPNQVKKDKGMKMGLFAIEGERIFKRDLELKIGIGFNVKERGVLGGPVFPVRKQSDYYVTVKPGNTERDELAKEIIRKLAAKAMPDEVKIVENIDPKLIENFLPDGKGRIVEGVL